MTEAERIQANLRRIAERVEARDRAQHAHNQAVGRRFQTQGAQIGALEGRVDVVETHLGDLTGLVDRQGQQQDMLRQAHETTATHVDRHDQQIATHDNWFIAIFERMGDRVDWAMVMLVSFVIGLVSIPFWYFWVFEQYGLGKHFADTQNKLAVDIPADPARMWIVSTACGVVLMFALAFVLSFVVNRGQNRADAAPPANAAANPAPAPAPTLELPAAPPAPAPAPAPANAGQAGNAPAAAAQ